MRTLLFFVMVACSYCDLYMMKLQVTNELDISPMDMCMSLNETLQDTGVLQRHPSMLECLETFTRPPTPEVCANQVICQLPLHEHNMRKLQLDSRHYDPYRVPCSVWVGKKCTSAYEFLNAHQCTGIDECIGCCIPEDPPSSPPLSPPPTPPFSPPSNRTTLETNFPTPPWAYVATALPILFGCFLCSGVLINWRIPLETWTLTSIVSASFDDLNRVGVKGRKPNTRRKATNNELEDGMPKSRAHLRNRAY